MPRAFLLCSVLLVLAGCGGGGGGTAAAGGGGARRSLVVGSITPPDGSTGVDPATRVVLQFRTPMDEAALQGGGLVLTPSGMNAPVSATVTVSLTKLTATLVPRAPLAGNSPYQVRLSALARRADGRVIGRPWFAEFRTGGGSSPPPPPPPPAQGGVVRPVGSLVTGRSGHAAAALPDGRVAVFGGFSTSSAVTSSIEVFDPGTETWTAAAAVLGLARARLTATVLTDGRVLLAGGETASTTDVGLDVWEIWDPGTDSLAASGTLAERRTRHRAVRLGDGTVLLVGGSRTDSSGAPNYSRATTEVFDPSVPGSSAGPAMAVSRAGHEATLLSDGRVLVTGGHGTSVLAEVFDPGAGSFSSAGTMVEPRRDHAATLLVDGTVLAAGRGTSSAERWLAPENRWVQVQNVGDERSLHTAMRIGNGRVFVAGGEKPAAGGSTFFHNGTVFYNPPTGTFLFPGLQTTVPRSGHTATPIAGGDCLIVGGKNSALGAPAVRTCDRVSFQ